MCAAEKTDIDLLPYHALALFAGIRPHELQRLEWRHIDLIEGHIEITPVVPKSGRRRIIEIDRTLPSAQSLHRKRRGNSRRGDANVESAQPVAGNPQSRWTQPLDTGCDASFLR